MFDYENLIQEFVLEAKTHIDKIEEGLLEIEKGDADADLIHAIFRSAHSIKGTAGFFGLQQVVALSHGMESLLGKIRNHDLSISEALVDTLLAANDELKILIDPIEQSEKRDISACLKRLEAAALGPTTGSEALEKHQVLLKKLAQHGRKIYQLVIPIQQSESELQRFYTNLVKRTQSIGEVLASYRQALTDGISTEQQELVFLFSTVLEKELAAMALEIDELAVSELSIRDQEAEIYAILEQAEQKEVFVPKKQVLSQDEQADAPGIKETISMSQEVERIRVDVALLDSLVNLSGEMVLARNQLLRLLDKQLGDLPGIRPILQKIDHTTTEMQEKIMRTRMQPIEILFHSLPRQVRELSKQLGKTVHLTLEGKEVELDKSILEGLADPLAHLVRNALDHGIETPELRRQNGKDPTASLTIKAYHESGHVTIHIMDDGAGINIEKIKQRALQQGLINKAEQTDLNDQEVVQFIFQPGLSTSAQINAVSGRGVGLDVVRTNIEKLGGIVEVSTIQGQGTTFRLILPLTLAIIPCLILEAANYQFALPQVHLRELVRVAPGRPTPKIEFVQGHPVLKLREQIIPVLDLGQLVGLPNTRRLKSDNIKVLVLKSTIATFGLLVDSIDDREETLVKPLPKYLKEKKIYSGVTILGNGRITFVLDADGLANLAQLALTTELPLICDKSVIESDLEQQQAWLLFQGSGPETLALALAAIARVEEIKPSQIEQIGSEEYYNLKGKIIRLIQLEKYLPLGCSSERPHKKFVIIPKDQQNLGLVAFKVLDSIQIEEATAQPDMAIQGLAGKITIAGKVVLSLNLPEILKLTALPRDSLGPALERNC